MKFLFDDASVLSLLEAAEVEQNVKNVGQNGTNGEVFKGIENVVTTKIPVNINLSN